MYLEKIEEKMKRFLVCFKILKKVASVDSITAKSLLHLWPYDNSSLYRNLRHWEEEDIIKTIRPNSTESYNLYLKTPALNKKLQELNALITNF
ncbi:MAG: hypothetical protein P8Y70_21445 [Candidatus Lokiarchaeota archaeon]